MNERSKNRLRWVVWLWWLVFIFVFALPPGHAEEPWRIRINIPEYKLVLYQGLELYHEYPIAVGKYDSPSPVGNFTIVNKVQYPTWYPPGHKQTPVPPGPHNPLGKFWIGLNIPGYGIHGNSAPQSIGFPVSLGCFRMHNPNIEQLFGIVPIGTPVEVVYQTVVCWVDGNDQAGIQVFPDIYRRQKTGEELATVLRGLQWIYIPHRKALQSLLAICQRPGKIQIPRVINIEGDVPGIDGFFWNGSIYISRNILAVAGSSGIPETGNSMFDGYLELHSLNYQANLEIYWNDASNTLFLGKISPENLL
jgi:L,D-transpeptidase ErfK/SrfK